LKRLKEVTVILFSLLIATVSLHATLKADSTSSGILAGDETWTYAPYDLENFTIIVLPDTQYYSESHSDIFDAQTQWIVDNIESMDIIFVTHLGDVVDDWSDMNQWDNASRSMSLLDGNVPWGILAGNHDGVLPEHNNFDKYFGLSRFSDESWYGGAYQGSNKNNYQLFSAGVDDYLILHLQYDPNDDVLEWANDVIDSYPNRRVLVSTHEYMGDHSFPSLTSIGDQIWEKLVSPNADQILLVLCGHLSLEQHRTDTIEGYDVHQMVSDYQNRPNGGNGWLRILEFSPLQDKIFVKTYSPYLDEFENDSNSEFTLDYDMTSAQANVTIVSNSTVSDFALDPSHNRIAFKLSGEMGTTGYCNVSIPQTLLEGNPWYVQIDEKLTEYSHYVNATHTSIYFNYVHSSVLQVSITGARVIPEFPAVLVLPLFLVATLLAIMVSKMAKSLRTSRGLI